MKSSIPPKMIPVFSRVGKTFICFSSERIGDTAEKKQNILFICFVKIRDKKSLPTSRSPSLIQYVLSVVNWTSGVLLRLQPYMLQARTLNWYFWLCSNSRITLRSLSSEILYTSTQICESKSFWSSSKYWGIFQS